MSEPLEWLRRAHGLEGLSSSELDAVRDFTLLWGLFEAAAMNTWGSPRKIFEAVDRMEMPEQLPTEIADALQFWRDRYWSNGEPTFAFEALNFTNDYQRAFVEQVLTGDRHSDGDCVKALLLIILRLRNNLFHGAKWRYRLQGQFDNLSHANGVLMRAAELAVPEPIADDLKSPILNEEIELDPGG